METSAELRDLTLRLYKALESTEINSFLESHTSQQDGVLMIGTAPEEWWSDYKTIIRKIKAQSEQMTMRVVDSNPQAFVHGDVGWVADQAKIALSNGGEIPNLRLTSVFQREGGEWKIVQWHVSIGIPNEDTEFGDIEL
jgi:adenylate cyclase